MNENGGASPGECNPPPRIVLGTTLWKRPELSGIVLGHYARIRASLAGRLDLVLLAAGSEGPASRRLCLKHGFEYLERRNRPVTAKWNGVVRAAQKFDPDGIVLANSDDLIAGSYFTSVAGMFAAGEDFFGLRDTWVLDLPSLRIGVWPGYDSTFKRFRAGEPAGCGRCYSRRLLERTEWRLWADDPGKNSSMDFWNTEFLRIFGFDPRAFRMSELDALAVQVKSDVNITAFDALPLKDPGRDGTAWKMIDSFVGEREASGLRKMHRTLRNSTVPGDPPRGGSAVRAPVFRLEDYDRSLCEEISTMRNRLLPGLPPADVSRLEKKETERDLRARFHEAVLQQVPQLLAVEPESPDAPDALHDYLTTALRYNLQRARENAGRPLCAKYLAWHLAYDLRACAAAYEKTDDHRFLGLLADTFEGVLDLRDSVTGMVDAFRGRAPGAWGSSRYTGGSGKWTVSEVLAGMILFPAVWAARVAKEREVRGKLRRAADRFQEAARTALREFEDCWREGPAEGEGHYRDLYLDDISPLNHMLALGTVHVEMYRLRGDRESLARAGKLASFFRNALRPQENGSCAWDYHPGKRGGNTFVEDVTHAQINILFAERAYRAGIVFDREDMARFAATAVRNVLGEDGEWAPRVDGSGKRCTFHEGLPGWIILDEFDGSCRGRIRKAMDRWPELFPLGWFSYATGPAAFVHLMKGASG